MAKKKNQSSPSPAFLGFDVPHQNWFKMPNNWTDITAGVSSLAELKVIEYVLKHTWGYREYGVTKRITTDEFMNGRRRKDGSRIDRGTGLSKPSVIAGLKAAIAHGFLEEVVDKADLGRIKKSYALKMLPDETTLEDKDQSPPETEETENEIDSEADTTEKKGVKHLNADVKNLYIGGNSFDINGKASLHRSEQETLERQQQTNTINNNTNEVEEETDVVVASLLQQGIGRTVAKRLAKTYEAEYIATKLEYLEFLLESRPEEIKKPAAWLRKAIEDDYAPPDGYVSSEKRAEYQEEENRRKQAVLEAQNQFLAQREIEEKEREEATAALRARLRETFGTTEEDIAIWETVLNDLSNGFKPIYALVANAEILRVTEDRVSLGIPHTFQLQQLQHPGYQAAIKRGFKYVTHRSLELETILITDDLLGNHPGEEAPPKDSGDETEFSGSRLN